MCVCSLNYPACNAHAPYCTICGLYHVFPYLINVMIFRKTLLNIKCVLIFSTTSV